jgi:hypothetical protein
MALILGIYRLLKERMSRIFCWTLVQVVELLHQPLEVPLPVVLPQLLRRRPKKRKRVWNTPDLAKGLRSI